MKIAVIGASGFIGYGLTHRLLEEGNEVVCVARNAEKIDIEHINIKKINADVLDGDKITKALEGCEVAYYLVHMMSQKSIDYADAEIRAATIFAEAALSAGVKRIVYLGGLGDDSVQLSKHLQSRHKSGEILRSMHPEVVEFRASMIVGKGSVSYDIVTSLVHKLPVLTLPKWSKTMIQPIGLQDMLDYLVAAKNVSLKESKIVEVGGPEIMSYRDFISKYCSQNDKKRILVLLPIIPVSIASWWLNIFTPKGHAKVGRAMVESLAFPMVVNDHSATNLFPKINPKRIEQYLN